MQIFSKMFDCDLRGLKYAVWKQKAFFMSNKMWIISMAFKWKLPALSLCFSSLSLHSFRLFHSALSMPQQKNITVKPHSVYFIKFSAHNYRIGFFTLFSIFFAIITNNFGLTNDFFLLSKRLRIWYGINGRTCLYIFSFFLLPPPPSLNQNCY